MVLTDSLLDGKKLVSLVSSQSCRFVNQVLCCVLQGLKYGMQGVMLTVMSGNMAAREFYSKLGYRVHNTSPGYDDATEAAGYEILHKPFRRRQPVSESTGKENNGH